MEMNLSYTFQKCRGVCSTVSALAFLAASINGLQSSRNVMFLTFLPQVNNSHTVSNVEHICNVVKGSWMKYRFGSTLRAWQDLTSVYNCGDPLRTVFAKLGVRTNYNWELR